MERREPKMNKTYRRALLIDGVGGGLCPKHGEYIGLGQYHLKDCPFCDIEEFYRTRKDKPAIQKPNRACTPRHIPL